MANDDNQSEQFIREVDEELRRDQLKSIWDRFGPYVIAACVLIVAVTAGYRGWGWWQAREAARQGDLFLQAMDARSGGNAQIADSLFSELSDGGRGYAILANLQMASALAEAGDADQALSAYDQIASDSRADAIIKDLANLKAALLALDAGDGAGAVARVEGLAVAGNPWRHAAREVLGSVAYSENRFDNAREHFESIQSDAESPPSARGRAALMLSLIDGQLAVSKFDTDTESPD